MFYSLTFLGRKGPLATVWCAAHVQHRLKKSHYTSTDISSTVDKIMFPEVPIALRMSGHLLFGVVRIYSKKVDYLYQDCNVVLSGLRKAFSSIDVTLPEDARQAPIQSITLPDTFDLDSVNLDSEILPEGSPDSHLRSQEDITLMDQIPAGINPYIVISFDEDMMMDVSYPEEGHTGIGTMEEPIFSPMNGSMGVQDLDSRNITKEHGATQDVQDHGLTGQTNLNAGVIGDGSPQNFPDIEVLRDTVHDFGGENLPQMYADHGNVVALENRSSGDIRNENETLSPIMDDMLPSREQSLPSQRLSEPTTSAASQQAPEIFEAHVSVGNMPVDLAIRSTPPVQQPQLRQRKRKRKFFFDESIVLSNRFLKKALEDSSDLLRKKQKSPCSALDVWKKKNRLRKEQVFNEPLVTGLCTDICNIFSKENFSSRPHLLLEEETIPGPGVPNSPAPGGETTTEPRVAPSPVLVTEAARDREPSPSVPEIDREIERMRDFEGHNGGGKLFPEDEYVAFPFRNDDSIHMPSNNLGLESVPMTDTIPGSGVLLTPGVAASTGTYGSEPETPSTFLVEGLGVGSTGLSDIPEIMNSAEADELYFLEADNNQSPGWSQGTETGHDLLPRTRAVFQYLERHSPSNPMLKDTPGDLSLSKILEGRSRKLCARMFYETLVLKTKQVVDVWQEIPYGDITLTLKSPPTTDA